jgi:GNAT superfamily N-acetyltransferase
MAEPTFDQIMTALNEWIDGIYIDGERAIDTLDLIPDGDPPIPDGEGEGLGPETPFRHLDLVQKHLPGLHSQKSHGRKGLGLGDLAKEVSSILANETFTDIEDEERPFSDLQDSQVAAGNCTQGNGDLGYYLARAGHSVTLVDLGRASFESHMVADADGMIVDTAWAQFGDAEWPVIMPRLEYLAWSGMHVVREEIQKHLPGLHDQRTHGRRGRRGLANALKVRVGGVEFELPEGGSLAAFSELPAQEKLGVRGYVQGHTSLERLFEGAREIRIESGLFRGMPASERLNTSIEYDRRLSDTIGIGRNDVPGWPLRIVDFRNQVNYEDSRAQEDAEILDTPEYRSPSRIVNTGVGDDFELPPGGDPEAFDKLTATDKWSIHRFLTRGRPELDVLFTGSRLNREVNDDQLTSEQREAHQSGEYTEWFAAALGVPAPPEPGNRMVRTRGGTEFELPEGGDTEAYEKLEATDQYAVQAQINRPRAVSTVLARARRFRENNRDLLTSEQLSAHESGEYDNWMRGALGVELRSETERWLAVADEDEKEREDEKAKTGKAKKIWDLEVFSGSFDPYDEISDEDMETFNTILGVDEMFGRDNFSVVVNTKEYDQYDSIVNLAGDVVDENGDPIGTWTRHFSASGDSHSSSPSAYHAYLELDYSHQGTGFGKEWSKHLDKQYAEVGIEEVHVEAALGNGGFTWARLGFQWDTDYGSDFAGSVPHRLRYMAEDDRATLDDSIYRQAIEWADALDNGDEMNMPTLRELSELGEIGGGDPWFGKEVLVGSSWHGKRRVGDPITKSLSGFKHLDLIQKHLPGKHNQLSHGKGLGIGGGGGVLGTAKTDKPTKMRPIKSVKVRAEDIQEEDPGVLFGRIVDSDLDDYLVNSTSMETADSNYGSDFFLGVTDEDRAEVKSKILYDLTGKLRDRLETDKALAGWVDKKIKEYRQPANTLKSDRTEADDKAAKQAALNRDFLVAMEPPSHFIEESHPDALGDWQDESSKESDEYKLLAIHTRLAIDSWAQTSGDHDIYAVAFQKAAMKKFGLKAEELDTDHMPFSVGNKSQGSYAGRVDEMLTDNDEFFGAFLDETYQETQRELKAQGKDTVTLFRGMNFGLSDTPDWARPPVKDSVENVRLEEAEARHSELLGRMMRMTPAEATEFENLESEMRSLREGDSSPQMGVSANILMQPLSSFSVGAETASGFGETVIAVDVPIERVWSTSQSGPGALVEGEFIVIGGATEGLVQYDVRAARTTNLPWVADPPKPSLTLEQLEANDPF